MWSPQTLSSVCCLRRPQESVSFLVRFTRTLAPPFQLLLFFLILDGSFQKLFPVAFLRQSKPLSNLIPDAAHPFPLLFATRCHSENQVSGDFGKGLKSDRRIPAVESSWDPLDCFQLRENVQLGEKAQQMLVARVRLGLRWYRCCFGWRRGRSSRCRNWCFANLLGVASRAEVSLASRARVDPWVIRLCADER